MYMVCLALRFDDPAPPRLGCLGEDLLASTDGLGREHAAPVLGHQNQVNVEAEDSISARCKALRNHAEPSYHPTVQRVYRYRLYPSAAQTSALTRLLALLRYLYNACLHERRDAWKKQRVSVSKAMQDKQLRAVRDGDPEYAGIHFHLLQDMVTRCDRAFQAFFRRVKAGQAPGFPRFKGRDAFSSFTFKDATNRNGVRLLAGGRRLFVHGVGNVKIKLHREHEGKLKQVRVLRLADGWYADFVCAAVPAKLLPKVDAAVGVDLGIKMFAALSDGTTIENPKHGATAASGLAAAQQRLSRRKKRSNRRRKAQKLVAKHHLRVARQRLDFHHKTALDLVRRHQAIYVEDLNVKGLASGMLAKQVSDVAWGQFIGILVSKAESAGREVVKVDPRGTSQKCSACGLVVPKGLSVRMHRCPCGYETDRDVNAARNIIGLGQSLRGGRVSGSHPEKPSPRRASAGDGVVTAGASSR